jgi:hypothetical protein
MPQRRNSLIGHGFSAICAALLACVVLTSSTIIPSAIAPTAIAQEREEPARPPVRDRLPDRFDIERFRQMDVIRRGAELAAQGQTDAAQATRRERDPRLADIDWTQARLDQERQLSEFRRLTHATPDRMVTTESYTPAVARYLQDQLEPVHMPVLLPMVQGVISTRSGGESGLMLRTRPNFYDASYDVDGMSVAISGTRIIRHRISSPEMQQRMNNGRDANGVQIESDESGGYTANFSRYRAAYTVTIECATARDPRCQSEDAIRDIVRSLVVAGGNPEE